MAKAPTMGRRAGTLHVRVIPDTRNFNKRLLAQLKRLEKQLPAMKVQVNDAHIQKAHVRRALQRQLSEIRNLKINVDVDAELNNVTRELDQLRERNKKFDLVPELDKVMLERIAKQTEAAIKRIEPTITPNVDDESVRTQVNSLARELNKLERDLKISVISPEHATQIRHRINEIGDELDEMAKDRTVRVDINPFTSWASARLAWLTRPRMVEIVPVVSKAALAKAATAIAALSGARLSYDYMKRFSDWISEVDKKLPSLTFGTLGITTAFSGLMGTLSGLVGIGDGLAATLPSLLLIPGLLAGAAMSGVALFVALKESKDELAELGDSYTNLGEIIKEAFWGEARESIISLSNSIMPQLERSFDKTSLAIGRFTAKLMSSFQTEFAGGRLEAMFDGLAASWDELAKGTDAFAGAITNLGLVAARYMPRLATWFVRQADTFDNWLSQVATDGRLDGWIEESIDAFYALWDVMAATTGIFQGIWKAAEAAGSGGLRGFADMLLRWEEAVNGSKWQHTLTSMFRGAGSALDGFGDGLARVGDMLYTQSSAIEHFMATAGQSLGSFIGDVADALARPAFARGMTDFIDGISKGLEGLAPALPALSDAFGTLLSFIGELAEVIGPVLAEAFLALAPALTEVLDALTPLLPQLGDAFVTAVRDLAPLIADLAGVIADVLPGAVDLISGLVAYAPELIALGTGAWLGAQLFTGFQQFIPGAAGALSSFGGQAVALGRFLISPWGLAMAAGAAALLVLDAALKNSTTNAIELETAIKQGAGAFDTMLEKAESNEQGLTTLFADVSQHFENLPALADKAAEAGRGFWSTMSFNENAALDSINALGDTLSRLAYTDLPAAQDAFAKFVKDGGLNDTQALTFLNEEMGSFKLQLLDAAAAAGVATDDATLLAFALGRIPESASGLKDAIAEQLDAELLGTKASEVGTGISKGIADNITATDVDVAQFNALADQISKEFNAGATATPPEGPWSEAPEVDVSAFSAAGAEAKSAFDGSLSDLTDLGWTLDPQIDVTTWAEQGTAAGEALASAAQTSIEVLDLSDSGLAMASSVATGVSSGSETVSAAVADMVTVASGSAAVDASALTASGAAVVSSFVAGITGAQANAATAATALGTAVITSLNTLPAGATVSGKAVADAFAKGITDNQSGTSTAGASIGSAAVSALSASATGSYSIGVNFGLGFAQGIQSQIASAAAAAARMASAASTSAKANLDVRSPSRVARYEIGQMFGEGYVLGILDKVPAAVRAANTLTGATAGKPRHAALSIQAPKFAAPNQRGSLLAAQQQTAQPAGNTTNVTANFIQPEQREQFREFTAVIERALR